MNKISITNPPTKILLTFSTVLLFLFASLPAQAKNVRVMLTIKNCKVAFKILGDDNCDANASAEQKACKRDNTCICLGRQDKIAWEVRSHQKYRIKKKSGKDVLSTNCGTSLKAGNRSCGLLAQAKKNETFDYDIEVAGCEEPFDPRIVVK